MVEDNYNWYFVTDPTDDISGWMKGSSATTTLTYLPNHYTQQASYEATSSDMLASTTRRVVIKDAIDHYYNGTTSTPSLYSSDDELNYISHLKAEDFVQKIIYGIALREDGPTFDNEKVTFDYGHGVMQITPYQVFSHESTSNWAENTGDNRGVASHIDIPPCATNASNLYVNCYTYAGDFDSVHTKAYKPYAGNSNNPTYKYYSNTEQSIYANVKDGMQILSQKLYVNNNDNISTSTTSGGYTFTASERKTILATEHYNGACGYVNDVASSTETISTYFPGVSTGDISDLIEKMHYIGNNAVCAQLHSPAELAIVTGDGKEVGVINGEGRSDLPFGIYDKEQKFVKILNPEGEAKYSYKVTGTASGKYGLDLTFKNNGETVTFVARDIPTSSGKTHEYNVDPVALSEGKDDAVTITIPADETSREPRTIKVGQRLTGQEFQEKAEKAIKSSEAEIPANIESEQESSENASDSDKQNPVADTSTDLTSTSTSKVEE